MIYIFDGTLQGLLTAVFEWFERKPGKIRLITTSLYQPDAFITAFNVESQTGKADRVWKGLSKKIDKSWQRKCYCCYLSEKEAAHQALFNFMIHVFSHPAGAEDDYGNEDVLTVSKYAHNVEREKHRMEAFIRFQHTADGIFYAPIDPDFNVLPLIAKHFKDRYADQQWIIYDLKRKYGLHYDMKVLQEITIDLAETKKLRNPETSLLDANEGLYDLLWKDYFKSTNIAARKNTKLHIKHVPKRYWKYLTEKRL